jgi:Ribonuclease G/E
MGAMIDTILIDALTPEYRIALLNNSRLTDIRVYRPDSGVRAGDVILGRVKAVVPSTLEMVFYPSLTRQSVLQSRKARP